MSEEPNGRRHRGLEHRAESGRHRDGERRPVKREGYDGKHNRDRHHRDKRRRSRSPEPPKNQDRSRIRSGEDHGRGDRRAPNDVLSQPSSGRQPNRSRSRSSTHSHARRRQRRSSAHSYASLYTPGELPFASRQLSRSDFETFKPLFARYLEVQKNLFLGDMEEREARGRWKSFVGKWNEGVLAEGWYDPEMFNKARREYREEDNSNNGKPKGVLTPPQSGNSEVVVSERKGNTSGDDEDDDDYGPRLPSDEQPRNSADYRGTRQGPGVPSLQDLELKRGMAEEDRLERIAQLRLERKADRAEQKARLEELLPRAEAGTRERQLEKKREVNEKMKQFREKSPNAAEVNDNELMGGGDSLDNYKRMKANAERKKTERELRREEIRRAKEAEREERLREFREKEESTIAHLKELARQRFG